MYEEFVNIINKNNGIITVKEAQKKGISRMNLREMLEKGLIERIEYGVYATNKFVYDEYYLFQLKHKNVIFSYNTALYFHNMTERTPIKMDVTTKRNTNLSAYKSKINLYRVNDEIFKLGSCEVENIYGNVVIVYDLERTVCDIIKDKDSLDIEIRNKAIKNCIKSKEFNVNKMFEYAKKMNIYDKVKQYMEAII